MKLNLGSRVREEIDRFCRVRKIAFAQPAMQREALIGPTGTSAAATAAAAAAATRLTKRPINPTKRFGRRLSFRLLFVQLLRRYCRDPIGLIFNQRCSSDRGFQTNLLSVVDNSKLV